MKPPIILFCLGLAGCQSRTPLVLPPSPPPEPRPVAVAPPAPPNPELQHKLHQQAQYIEALISQNEALAAKLAAKVPALVPEPPPLPPVPELPAAPTPVTPVGVAESYLSPNADGIIDLAAVAADANAGEPVNPFAVRATGSGPSREMTVQVSGILGGKTPCAVINERVVQANDRIEALTVERIEPDAVCLNYAGRRLRVPVSGQVVRIKLPL